MSISALTSNPLTQLLATDFNALRGNNTNTQQTASSAIPTDSASGVSPFAQMYSKLESLASSDPDKFKALTSQIASQLKDAAGKATGGAADFLNNLASRFEKASQSGNASDLQPPQATGGASGHHHRHHHYSNSDSTSTTDVNSLFGANSTNAADPTQTNLQDLFQNILSEVSKA